ncbi:hypothetical protein F5Y12DRAFT_658981 [Xylaria sp. FL1777]|nr:hypothetical protein F5Y12DRAFT_658981 [Xylaria sp. FL1777]
MTSEVVCATLHFVSLELVVSAWLGSVMRFGSEESDFRRTDRVRQSCRIWHNIGDNSRFGGDHKAPPDPNWGRQPLCEREEEEVLIADPFFAQCIGHEYWR